MKRIAELLLLAALAVVVAGAAPAFGEPPATLATWSLVNTLTGTTIVPDALSVGDITAGNGVGTLSLSAKGYSGQGWNSASRNEDAYFEFSVTAVTNWSFSPGELSMNFRSAKTGPAKAEVRWSLDGSAWTTAGTMDVPLDGNDRGHPFTVDFTGVTVGGGETFAVRIYAWGASAKSGTFRIGNAYAMTLSGSVARRKMVTATVANPARSFAEDEMNEQEVVTFGFGEEGFSMPNGELGGYLFLVPRNDSSSNLVYSADFGEDWESGVFVISGDQGTEPFSMFLLDNNRTPAERMGYDIVVRSARTWDEGYTADTWSSQGFDFTVTNVVPTVTRAFMGGSEVNESGGQMAGRALAGVPQVFKAETSEPSGLDLYSDSENGYVDSSKAFATKWAFALDGDRREFAVKGPPGVTALTHAFDRAGVWTVIVSMRDKDMISDGQETWGPEFPFTVVVDAPPSVSNVVARQRWPWNGLVDVDYEVGGDTDGLEARISFAASDGRSWVATNFLAGAEPSVDPGPHRATWNATADAGAGVVASNVVATVELVPQPTFPSVPRIRATVGEPRAVQLFVVPDGDPLDLGLALPNEDFYVYAPQAGSDSVSFTMGSSEHLSNAHRVNSGDQGFVVVSVTGLRPVRDVVVGTSKTDDLSDVIIHRVFDFYESDDDGDAAAAAATSAEFRLDTREGPLPSDGTETLTYSTRWHPAGDATVTILQRDAAAPIAPAVPVASGLFDEGDAVWQVFEGGTYVLAHATVAGDTTVSDEETATFVVPDRPPVVSNVVARQRWPWNGLVDVDYEVGGTTTGLVTRISFAEQGGAGRSWVATNFLAGAEPSAEPGFHRATWDTKADGVTNVVAAKVTATVELVREPSVSDGNVWSLIGDFNSWAGDVDMTLTDGKWVSPVTKITAGGFKIRYNHDWTENVGGVMEALGIPFAAISGGDNISIEEGNDYVVTYDPDERTILVEVIGWGVVGTINSWGGSADLAMKEENGMFARKNVTLAAHDEIKVRYRNSWDVNYGGRTDVGFAVKAISAGDNLKPGAGTYDIWLDAEKKALFVMEAGDAPEYWGVFGTINGWGGTPDAVMYHDAEGYFVAKGIALAADDEIKIRKNSDWTDNRGASYAAPDTALDAVSGGDSIKVAAGTYDVYYQSASEKIYVMTAGKTPADAQ